MFERRSFSLKLINRGGHICEGRSEPVEAGERGGGEEGVDEGGDGEGSLQVEVVAPGDEPALSTRSQPHAPAVHLQFVAHDDPLLGSDVQHLRPTHLFKGASKHSDSILLLAQRVVSRVKSAGNQKKTDRK